jgi:hypothetical protein
MDRFAGEEEEKGTSLPKLMKSFSEVERLKGDNKYFCDNCNQLTEAERSLHYNVVIGTDCTGSCKSDYHMITTTTAPRLLKE